MELTPFARKYIWWQPTEVASLEPRRVIAQVMNLGTFEDVMALRQLVGNAELSRALKEARPGEFSDRSWHYWHLVLGIAPLSDIPPLPVRRLAEPLKRRLVTAAAKVSAIPAVAVKSTTLCDV
jgi:hypothetical protein